MKKGMKMQKPKPVKHTGHKKQIKHKSKKVITKHK